MSAGEDFHTVEIEDLGSAGDGVGRLANGRVVFVAGALPGDQISCRLGQKRNKVQFAELISIVSPSPDRVRSVCTVARCGGCPLRELSAARQRALKGRRILDSLRRLGNIDAAGQWAGLQTDDNEWHYRHRVRLHAAWVGAGWQFGYHERGSQRLVPISACPVLWPELEEAVLRLTRILYHVPAAARIRQLEACFSRRDGRCLARVVMAGPVGRVLDHVPGRELQDVELAGSDAAWPGDVSRVRYDHADASEFDLWYEAGAFTQANPGVNDLLVRAVTAAIQPQQHPRVLEIHAGIGNFTLPLTRAGARVTTCESSAKSVAICRHNLAMAGLDADVRLTATTSPAVPGGPFDVLLLDPPRTGAEQYVRDLDQKGWRPSRVAYVACDPATFARDSALLVQQGFRLQELHGFDLFPQTAHVECLGVFAR